MCGTDIRSTGIVLCSLWCRGPMLQKHTPNVVLQVWYMPFRLNLGGALRYVTPDKMSLISYLLSYFSNMCSSLAHLISVHLNKDAHLLTSVLSLRYGNF